MPGYLLSSTSLAAVGCSAQRRRPRCEHDFGYFTLPHQTAVVCTSQSTLVLAKRKAYGHHQPLRVPPLASLMLASCVLHNPVQIYLICVPIPFEAGLHKVALLQHKSFRRSFNRVYAMYARMRLKL
eukprot:1150389-Pelagomonas_calceolata.AAC.4